MIADLPPPVEVRRPAGRAGPFIFASPHAGTIYPEALRAVSMLDARALRGSEDALVDRLIAGMEGLGATLILNRIARAYVDVNRGPSDLDPALVGLPGAGSPRAEAGFGVVPRRVGEGQDIYAEPLKPAEVEARIAAVHRPYHDALTALVREAQAEHGWAAVIDWHSMPSPGGQRAQRLIVLGDRHGASCASALTGSAKRLFQARGYQVGLNAPYAGGWTTQAWGRPGEGVHALQIEIDRSLYLDPDTLEPNAGFERLRSDLHQVARGLLMLDLST
ncbi:N-formylglutamate amidohydrolase [Brevundimonas sp. 2R-24]|uniref:N-formylglutamate amidohydrolase n=1 Tax=Peiella sedimenti TaxID=3061083 RepID=A0ABT8SGZ0_9CAUL|nr:N-formylglutamate amidohydrolase [Caulobacteraceae bacterium XZ-24]